MDSQHDRTPDGAEPSPKQHGWVYRWLGWMEGLPSLAAVILALRWDYGLARLSASVFFFGLLLSGFLDELVWLLELFGQRCGETRAAFRRRLPLLRTAVLLLILVSGFWWLLKH